MYKEIKSTFDLERGDIVKCAKEDSYVVASNYGHYAIAHRHHHITNPIEWNIVTPTGTKPVEHITQLVTGTIVRHKMWDAPKQAVVLGYNAQHDFVSAVSEKEINLTNLPNFKRYGK